VKYSNSFQGLCGSKLLLIQNVYIFVINLSVSTCFSESDLNTKQLS